jgi:hypothetical protein
MRTNDVRFDGERLWPSDPTDGEDGQRAVVARLRALDDDFRYPYDDSLAALDELLDDDADATIAELMRHDVDRRRSGSRGRRRRGAKARDARSRAAPKDAVALRIGRPTIGAEVRVYVQTSIAQCTRDALIRRKVTLADVFDDIAQRLGDEH